MEKAKDKPWYKSWWAFLIIAFIGLSLLPITVGFIISFLIYKLVKSPNWKWPAILLVVMITLFFSTAWLAALKEGFTTQSSLKEDFRSDVNKVSSKPTSSINPTTAEKPHTPTLSYKPTEALPTKSNPTPTVPEPTKQISAYEFFNNLGKDVSDNSNISVIDNNDGTIDVFNIIENQPDVVIKSTFEASTRNWVLEFMRGVYTSSFKIRYVQMSVTWLYTGVSPTQVGLGINQAANITNGEWESTTPYDFCKWLENVSTGKNDNNPANSTYTTNFNCS